MLGELLSDAKNFWPERRSVEAAYAQYVTGAGTKTHVCHSAQSMKQFCFMHSLLKSDRWFRPPVVESYCVYVCCVT